MADDPKPKRPRCQPMPEKMRAEAADAKARCRKLPVAPEVRIDMPADSDWWDFGNPYSERDLENWFALICAAFGTRLYDVAYTFVQQLADLCPTEWSEKHSRWKPTEQSLRMAIAIVGSVKPRNEAEAALAAQMVAIHFASMKMGKEIAGRSYPDPRTMAAQAALAKAYASQMDTMNRLKGRKTTRQKITVKYERHNHEHRHVHFEGGDGNSGGQPHEARARPIEASAQVSGDGTLGEVLPFPGDQGKAGLPVPRRKGRCADR